MSPKKAGRGQRYTTGIKKNSRGGYGGQTTGRNGCLAGLVVLFIALVGSFVTIELLKLAL